MKYYRNLSKYSTVVLLLVITTVSSTVQQVFDSGKSTPGAVHRGKRAPADPERVPLLYDYYSGALSNGYDKRNFDEIDRGMFDRWLLKKAYDNVGSLIDEAARRDESFTYGKRNFDEIDRSAFNGFNKRLPFGNYLLNTHKDDSNPDKKRNFDEIDRAGFHGFKRNFDEIDRVGFNHLKKKNFDEIDRVGFHGFKRNV